MDEKVMNRTEIKDKLIEFLCDQFMVDEEDIDLNESLVDTGIIDSMGLIEIAAYIENEYSFKVTEEMMKRVNFGSVNKIYAFIISQIKA